MFREAPRLAGGTGGTGGTRSENLRARWYRTGVPTPGAVPPLIPVPPIGTALMSPAPYGYHRYHQYHPGKHGTEKAAASHAACRLAALRPKTTQHRRATLICWSLLPLTALTNILALCSSTGTPVPMLLVPPYEVCPLRSTARTARTERDDTLMSKEETCPRSRFARQGNDIPIDAGGPSGR